MLNIKKDKNIFKQNKPNSDMDKRGQELSTNAIIMIIIGVIVLVVLILGFSLGWNKVLPFVSSNNVQNIQTGCSTACSTSNAYDYCYTLRDINTGTLTLKNTTCNYLAQDQPTYGISLCSSITCPNVVLEDPTQITTIGALKSSCSATANEGKTVEVLISNSLISVNCSPTGQPLN